MLSTRVALVVAAFLCCPAWGTSQNIIVNGGFDGNVDGWKIVRGEGDQAWDTLDVNGNPQSGSLHLVNTGAGPNPFTVSGQCLPLTPAGTYEAGASIRFPSPAVPGGFGSVVVGWFGNPCCTGPPLGAASTPAVSSTTTDTWVESFTPVLTPPPGTVAVGIGLGLLLGTEGALDGMDVRWPRNPACPEAAADPAPAAPGPAKVGTGASLEAHFDGARFGTTGTTPVEVQAFSVE
jgi:hypothetical protein